MRRLRAFIWIALLLCVAFVVVTVLARMIGAPKQSLDPALLLTAEYLEQHPLPKPQFIEGFSSDTSPCGDFYMGIYVSVDQRAIWETGDEADALSKRIMDAQIRIDGEIVPKAETDYTDYLTAYAVLDQNNHRVGSIGAGTTCIDVSHLASGLHLATIRITSTSHVEYSFTWAFRAIETQPFTIGLPTAAHLPTLTPSPMSHPSPTPAATDSSLMPRPSSL